MEEATRVLLSRATSTTDAGEEFLKLLKSPFESQLAKDAVFAALGSSLGITAAIALGFSLVRPFNSVVYAPKVKHADEKHAPPPLGKGIFAWVKPLWKTTEQDLVNLVGMDAALFMRFARMCRDMFLVLAVLGCAILIPINWTYSTPPGDSWLARVTPMNVWGQYHWATVVVAWVFTIVICGFLWWNYRKVVLLRRRYFESEEYQQSLHARTLMLYDLPKSYSSDEGIARIIDTVVPNSSFSRTAVARDVKVLPSLIDQHAKTVRKLEKVLAIYLKDPKNLPPARPLCRPSKKDPSFSTYPKDQKVDAIEYLTQRIKVLELEIKEVRQRVDKRGSMPYGFASYADISETHAIAYVCRKKHPHGATITLAPRPNDVIWENMPLSSSVRSTRRLWNGFWITVLTVLWIAPNAMISIFLVNLSNLGNLWPAFKRSLESDQTLWSIVQGIASPAVTSLVYLVLPIIFRRISQKAGDQTKTGRERHVVAKLYAFFVFNNLFVFSVFSAIWSFVTAVIKGTGEGGDPWLTIVNADFGNTIFVSMCTISGFWVSWLLQRQLGAAIDLAQLWTLIYSFIMRKLSSPTPRELIELTAPPPFDYASYYNYFLFYATVALSYAVIQPLVLPAAALYFAIDVALKKYLLLYIFVTKTESGGMFWRTLFNRFLFGTILSQIVIFMAVWVRGDDTHVQAYAVAPLPFLVIGFKIYCRKAFDDKIQFYATRAVRSSNAEAGVKDQSLKNDRLAARFGHPALYKPLITPMVHAKAQNVLASVYRGRLTDGRDAESADAMSVSGYSDMYAMDNMASGKAGKISGSAMPGFEVVPESKLDFEFYKNRDEFAADHGAGELFGRQSDIIRPGTPGTIGSGGGLMDSEYGSRPGTPVGGMGFGAGRKVYSPQADGLGYQSQGGGYFAQQPQQPPSRYGSPAYPGQTAYSAGSDMPGRTRSPGPLYNLNNDSASNLVVSAAGMPVSTPGYASADIPPEHTGYDRERSLDSTSGGGHGVFTGVPNPRAILRGRPYGYGGVPQSEDESLSIAGPPSLQSPPIAGQQDPMQYDYFRGGRGRGNVRDASGSSTPGAATRTSPYGNNNNGGWN